MDPKTTKFHSRRVAQDADQQPSKRTSSLFHSETIPPLAQQSSRNRTHNLSDRVHDYYEKLMNNPPVKRTNTSTSSQPPLRNLHHRFAECYLSESGLVGVSRDTEQHQPSSSVQTPVNAPKSHSGQPYTVYVEDPSGSLQQFQKRTPASSSSPAGLTNFEKTCYAGNFSQPETSSSKLQRPNSLLPSYANVLGRPQCVFCQSTNHSSQDCSLCIPPEQDSEFQEPARRIPSSKYKFKPGEPVKSNFVGCLEKQGDGSEDGNQPSAYSKRRPIPENINTRCERDVIGQERSPVSKSHPAGSTALSTSSSNGDSVPRERKKWVRPPLVGQAASTVEKSLLMNPGVFDCLDESHRLSSMSKSRTSDENTQLCSSSGSDHANVRYSSNSLSQAKSSYFDTSGDVAGSLPENYDEFPAGVDRDLASVSVISVQQQTSEGEQGLSDSCAGGRVSPSSSVTSNRRLEWDSGADVGYNQIYGSPNAGPPSSGLCTIERMALAQGCSVALQLRLDPEGTTVPTSSTAPASSMLPSPAVEKSTPQSLGKPTAESTPLDQVLSIPKAALKNRNDFKKNISRISGDNLERSDNKISEMNTLLEEETHHQTVSSLKVSDPPAQKLLSNSMQDLRKCQIKQSESQLLKSQSDPDISGSSPTLVSKVASYNYSKDIFEGQHWNVAAQSISSGSDATLINVGAEEDLAVVGKEENAMEENTSPGPVNLGLTSPIKSASPGLSQATKTDRNNGTNAKNGPPITEELNNLSDSTSKPALPEPKTDGVDHAPPLHVKEAKSSHNFSVCSNTDHERGLHHHFGVLCSTVFGGHIQSTNQHNEEAQPESNLHNLGHIGGNVFNKIQSRGSTQSPPLQEQDVLSAESTASSAFHSDNAREENAPVANTLTGRAHSFEYLPGHMYIKNSAPDLRGNQRPPGISTSTETDSEPVRLLSNRVIHRKVIDSSSLDTEDDRLWGSPRGGSNTLVQDLERGVSLLKGVLENKSAGRRCKRELIRRVIKRLVTSEYVEDMIEREKVRHQARSPFSPRKAKHMDRNFRARRSMAPERQEISGESDEPKERAHNVRRKMHVHQTLPVPSEQRDLSTAASASKSSSLLSSHAESSSGSISLSGSSDHQKESKISVKPNPLYKPLQEGAADWLKPTTHSEKLFEMRKIYAEGDESHKGLTGSHFQEPHMNPILFSKDKQKQLSWIKNEINHLKVLKQLLQKQESINPNVDPNLCQSTLITMPVTGLKQTMQMADCTSPDGPGARSPKQQSSRLQQWVTLESDTSAGFGLSNNTESSQESQWHELEVVSGGEQDNQPHKTVSISDGDQITHSSGSNSVRKSECSQSSCSGRLHKSRRRSVSISDGDQQFVRTPISDVPILKKRPDCCCGKSDGRTYSARPVQVSTFGPPQRNLLSDKDFQAVTDSKSYMAQREYSHPAEGFRGAMNQLAVSSRRLPNVNLPLQQTDDESSVSKVFPPKSCTCGPSVSQVPKSYSCKSPEILSSSSIGANIKGVTSSKIVPKVGSEITSSSSQPIPGGGLARVHIETDQLLDSSREKPESQRIYTRRDIVNSADPQEREKSTILRPASDDSLTKAVTEAVSSKVKALKNLGQIEEAEVKIRVKVGQNQVCDDPVLLSENRRVLKTQDLEEDQVSVPSKLSEMNDMIARQRAIDHETRQKLLAIAESRQRAQFGLNDVDRRIQDLLLQDYLNRQFKMTESSGATQARLNVSVETPAIPASSVGIQSSVDKKTVATSTMEQVDQSTTLMGNQGRHISEPYSQQQSPRQKSQGTCICGPNPMMQQSLYQEDQNEVEIQPQTMPTSCRCSCQSQPASSYKTHSVLPVLTSPERRIEFELELHKQRPFKLSPQEVHNTLKSRNTAYFLQFEEDQSLSMEQEMNEKKPPIEVVTVKIPKDSKSKKEHGSINKPVPSQGRSEPVRPKRPIISHGGKDSRHINGPVSSHGRKDSDQVLRPLSSTGSKDSGGKNSLEGNDSSQVLQQGDTTEGTSHSELGDNFLKEHVPESEFQADPNVQKNLLRITPGRSHLSITITDSSADSIRSPDGDSRDSSLQHPARKVRRSPQTHKRGKVHLGGHHRGSGVFSTRAETEKKRNLRSSASAEDQVPPSQYSRQPSDRSDSLYDLLGDGTNTVPTLQEYLEKNHPKYLDAAEKRRRCIAEMSYLRRLRQQSRKRLLELEGDKMWAKQKQQWRSRCFSRPRPVAKKKLSPKTIKSACNRRYVLLPENQQRLLELKRREEKRTNRLMAEIYTRKLQEKVLKGSATIRSSISVISSI